jgi:hypothetical protein
LELDTHLQAKTPLVQSSSELLFGTVYEPRLALTDEVDLTIIFEPADRLKGVKVVVAQEPITLLSHMLLVP